MIYHQPPIRSRREQIDLSGSYLAYFSTTELEPIRSTRITQAKRRQLRCGRRDTDRLLQDRRGTREKHSMGSVLVFFGVSMVALPWAMHQILSQEVPVPSILGTWVAAGLWGTGMALWLTAQMRLGGEDAAHRPRRMLLDTSSRMDSKASSATRLSPER